MCLELEHIHLFFDEYKSKSQIWEAMLRRVISKYSFILENISKSITFTSLARRNEN